MNATDLQKLKELAQVATPGPWIKQAALTPYIRRDDETDWTTLVEAQSEGDIDFIAAANPAAVLELIEIAERAVSPAESVQSIEYLVTYGFTGSSRSMSFGPMQNGPYVKKEDMHVLLAQPLPTALNLSAAFGEKAAQETVREFGQRMYEQGKADAAQPLQQSCESCCKHDSDCAVHNAPAYPPGPCDCSVLQQEGGKEEIDSAELAAELEREWLRKVIAEMRGIADVRLVDGAFKAGFETAVDEVEARCFPAHPSDNLQQASLRTTDTYNYVNAEVAKELQASTAQVEPAHDSDCAVHNAPAHAPGPCDCSLSVPHFASAADCPWGDGTGLLVVPNNSAMVGQIDGSMHFKVDGKLVFVVDAPVVKQVTDFGVAGDGVTDDTAVLQAAVDSFSEQALTTANPTEAKKAWLDALASGTGVLVGGKHVPYHDILNPATPEGAELPNCDEKFEEAWPRIHAHGAENGWRGIALAAWKERGALAAATAAEPVYQMRHRIEPVWTDCSDFVVESWLENGGDPTRVRTLYRAAPPQQVSSWAELLEGLLHELLNSTDSYTSALECDPDFSGIEWTERVEKALGRRPGEVDTGGLPG